MFLPVVFQVSIIPAPLEFAGYTHTCENDRKTGSYLFTSIFSHARHQPTHFPRDRYLREITELLQQARCGDGPRRR